MVFLLRSSLLFFFLLPDYATGARIYSIYLTYIAADVQVGGRRRRRRLSRSSRHPVGISGILCISLSLSLFPSNPVLMEFVFLPPIARHCTHAASG